MSTGTVVVVARDAPIGWGSPGECVTDVGDDARHLGDVATSVGIRSGYREQTLTSYIERFRLASVRVAKARHSTRGTPQGEPMEQDRREAARSIGGGSEGSSQDGPEDNRGHRKESSVGAEERCPKGWLCTSR